MIRRSKNAGLKGMDPLDDIAPELGIEELETGRNQRLGILPNARILHHLGDLALASPGDEFRITLQ
jgi:hypothetical protein